MDPLLLPNSSCIQSTGYRGDEDLWENAGCESGDESNASQLHCHSELYEQEAASVFLFLMTHAPVSPDEPLRGIFTNARPIAESAATDPAFFIADVCDLLTFLSIPLCLHFERIFEEKSVSWTSVLAAHRNNTRRQRHSRICIHGQGCKGCDGKTLLLPVYYSNIIGEMFYWSLRLEISSARPKKEACIAERQSFGWMGRENWFGEEYTRREAQYPTKHPDYIAWYDLPVTEKIQKLRAVLDFIDRRLPAECDALQYTFSDLPCPKFKKEKMEIATAFGLASKYWKSYCNINDLKACLKEQLSEWELYADQIQWNLSVNNPNRQPTNPAKSGFPSSRNYLDLPKASAPRAPHAADETAEGKYPQQILNPFPEARFNFAAMHPEMPPYQRSDLLDVWSALSQTRTRTRSEEQVQSFARMKAIINRRVTRSKLSG